MIRYEYWHHDRYLGSIRTTSLYIPVGAEWAGYEVTEIHIFHEA